MTLEKGFQGSNGCWTQHQDEEWMANNKEESKSVPHFAKAHHSSPAHTRLKKKMKKQDDSLPMQQRKTRHHSHKQDIHCTGLLQFKATRNKRKYVVNIRIHSPTALTALNWENKCLPLAADTLRITPTQSPMNVIPHSTLPNPQNIN